MISKNTLLDKLKKLNIRYQLIEHEAFFTVEDSIEKRSLIRGAHTKNLFLKNKKKQFFLISCLENRQINLKELSKKLNIGNISFANEKQLNEYLGLKPGSVSPFGILNDNKNKVQFYLDYNITSFDMVSFHPLINTSTITLKVKDLINFLIYYNKKVNIFCFDTYSIIE
jgi:Ala-tRNA(Pro) deacylase